MRNKNQIRFGAIVIMLGLMLLISNLTGIPLWSYIWPLLLIGIGIYIFLHPENIIPNANVQFRLLGGMDYQGTWILRDENIISLIGDINLDLTKAEIPPGETRIELRGFVGDIDIVVPPDTGIAVVSNAFVTSAHVLNENSDYFLTPYEIESENYASSERKVILILGFFVTNLHLTQLNG